MKITTVIHVSPVVAYSRPQRNGVQAGLEPAICKLQVPCPINQWHSNTSCVTCICTLRQKNT